MIFARRGKRGPDPHLPKKVQLFFLAAALALVGMALESSWLVGLAIFALAVGVALRFLPGGRGESERRDVEGGESHADEDPNLS